MKFNIYRTSDLFPEFPPCQEAVLKKKGEWSNDYEIEINTLEELMGLISKYGSVVVSSETLEIYDNKSD